MDLFYSFIYLLNNWKGIMLGLTANLLTSRLPYITQLIYKLKTKLIFFRPETSKRVSTLKMKNKVVDVEEINFSIFFRNCNYGRSAVADL